MYCRSNSQEGVRPARTTTQELANNVATEPSTYDNVPDNATSIDGPYYSSVTHEGSYSMITSDYSYDRLKQN